MLLPRRKGWTQKALGETSLAPALSFEADLAGEGQVPGRGAHVQRVPPGRTVQALLRLYGVEDPDQRDALLSLAKQANRSAWWHGYSDILPSWFQTSMGLEETAMLIRAYEGHLVPGLRCDCSPTTVRTPRKRSSAARRTAKHRRLEA
jgi:hypothetical protein